MCCPSWNPYLFSGTPLLGGFNAGAAYPTTWLMAVLPTFAAWWLNLALAYDVALLGTYLFLRRQSVGVTAATFAAATFAFAGYMTGSDRPHRSHQRRRLAALDTDRRPRPHAAPAGRLGPLRPVRSAVAGGPVGRPFGRRASGLTILTGGAEAIIDSASLVCRLRHLAARVTRAIR